MVLVTEWPQFRKPDWERAKELLAAPVVFDGRNQYDLGKMRQMGFEYFGVGRKVFKLHKLNHPRHKTTKF